MAYIQSFFFYHCVVFYCMNILQFVHPFSIYRHLGGFQFGAIITIVLYILCCTYALISIAYIPIGGIDPRVVDM